MLWTRLAAATAGGLGLQFVGGNAFSNATSATPSCSLTGLTGGLASAPAAGDIVIACIAFEGDVDRDISCTTSGYTEVADLFSSGTNGAQLGIFYKVLSTAETSVAFNIANTTSSRFAVHVWRGQNSTPLDATTATVTSTGGGRPNPPSITTVTNDAIIIAVGAMAGSSSNQLVTPTVSSGMTNLFTAIQSITSAIAIESIARPTAGAYDPAEFGGFSTSSNNGSCAATIAIRPA